MMTACKLACMALVSSLWLLFGAFPALAHEVTPTIGDLEVTDDVLTLDLRMNIEGFLLGLDLDALADTNDSGKSAEYDSLRALSPDALEPQVRNWAQGWLPTLIIEAGAPVPLSVVRIDIAPVGDVDVTRPTHLIVSGTLPAGEQVLTVAWPAGSGDLVLRQQGVDAPYTGYIEGGQTSEPIAIAGGSAQSGWEAFVAYIPVGFDHILPKGLDHILFVLGLFFLSMRLGPLLWQISAFTLAHTVTLAMGALGWVSVPGSIVEPLIAASITYVAVENIFTSKLHRWRPLIVFGFGLLHGLGFASVLEEFGLPQDQFIPALLGFNIGVELGQLTVIAIAFLAVGVWFGKKDWYRAYIAIPASAVIALIGAYWFVERVFF